MKYQYVVWASDKRCTLGGDADLEYYIRECGDILGVTKNLPQDSRDAKHVLEYILMQVAEFKKLNQVANHLAYNIL